MSKSNSQSSYRKKRAFVLEPLEERSLLTTLIIDKDTEPGTTILKPDIFTGTGLDTVVFWGGDHEGFQQSYYVYDWNGATGAFSLDLGSNPKIKVIGTSVDDKITNQTGDNNKFSAAEFSAYGKGGNDTLRGSSGYDKLVGGPGTDVLFGLGGDDVLFGGWWSQNDELYGGTGEDRFYIRTNEFNVKNSKETLAKNTVKDKHKHDARVFLVDTKQIEVSGGTSYEPAVWLDQDFEAIDQAFQHMYSFTQSQRFMQSSTGGDIYEYRLGLTTTGDAYNGAWSNGSDSDWYPGKSGGTDSLTRDEGAVIFHEIAHHWDDKIENRWITGFRNITGWTDTLPDNPREISFDTWLQRNKNPNYTGHGKGYVRSASGEDVWFQPGSRSPEQLFFDDYGGHAPQEDFSVTSEHYWLEQVQGGSATRGNQAKLNYLKRTIDDLSTPTTPCEVKVDQVGNHYRPVFSWETMVGDSFRLVLKGNWDGQPMVWEHFTDELDNVQIPFDLAGGDYTLFVSSYNHLEQESAPASITFNVNHAPVWDSSIPVPNLKNINEDARNNPGTWVRDLTAGVVDGDHGSKKGIAVFKAPSQNGYWEYSLDAASTWTKILPASRSSARLIPDTGLVRFVPAKDFNGLSPQLGYYAWDQTQGTAGGTFDISNGKIGGTTAFSQGYQFSRLTVNSVNDAPVWNNSPVPNLRPIMEDPTNNPGTTIESLTDGFQTDVDAGAKKGIAFGYIRASIPGNYWQYTLDGGRNWKNVPVLRSGIQLLLPADGNRSRIRFVPNDNWNGTGHIGYYAWDQTQGTAGGTFDISGGKVGGATAFSAGIHYSSVTVKPVNDAPSFSSRAAIKIKSNEDRVFTFSVSYLTKNVVDNDGNGKGIAITKTTQTNNVKWEYTTDAGKNWKTMAQVSSTNALLLKSDDSNWRVRFAPNENWNGVARLTFHAWDQSAGRPGSYFDIDGAKTRQKTAFSADNVSFVAEITPVNDAPTLTNTNISQKWKKGWEITLNQLLSRAGYNDVDGKGKGIAFWSSDYKRSGWWQYKFGGTWRTLQPNSPESAKLLGGGDTKLRFLPNPKASLRGKLEFSFRAWDLTVGKDSFDLTKRLRPVDGFSAKTCTFTLNFS